MPITQFIAQTDQEILQERLKKQISLSWKKFYPLGIWVMVFIPFKIANEPDPTGAIFTQLYVGFIVSILLQGFLLIWTAGLHFLQPGKNRSAATLCFWLNILFIICWPYFLVQTFLQDQFVAFLILLSSWIIFILDVISINRLIRACCNPTTTQAKQLSSPCPLALQSLAFLKSLPALPLVAFITVATISFIITYILKHNFTEALQISCAVGIFFAIPCCLVSLLFGGSIFITPTASPSTFQRVVRWLFLEFIIHPVRRRTKTLEEERQEIVSFYWWLSHPGQPWPDQLKVLAKDIDTDKFDWQNPKEWPF